VAHELIRYAYLVMADIAFNKPIKLHMNNKLSRKHHYLPRYYLKGFINNSGSFYIYDKTEDKIFVSNPDKFFLENNLNTIYFPDGTKSDFLEYVYSDLEGKSWESLDNIRQIPSLDHINITDKMRLFLFLLFLHWRLPSNFVELENLSDQMFIDGSNLDYFSMVDNDGNQVSEAFLKEFKYSKMWIKSSQIIVPFAPFFKSNTWYEDLENWKFIYTEDNKSWFVVGDNPIVSSGKLAHDPIRCLETFMFPVSGKILLVSYKGNILQELPSEFIIQFSTAIIHRSERFVACHNKEFLEALINDYKFHVENYLEDNIIDELFSMIQE
jgi:hypothetical protein